MPNISKHTLILEVFQRNTLAGIGGKSRRKKKLHELLSDFRTQNPEAFGAFYDSAQSSIPHNALTSKQVTIPGRGDGTFNFWTHPKNECPHNTRNLYEGHQEIAYYPQNRDGRHGLAVWIPLRDVTLHDGALFVAKHSHEAGVVKTKAQKETKLSSTQNRVPDEILKKYEEIQIPVKAGDALIMYMSTMHKSGHNFSQQFRFVAIGRYHIATQRDFTPYRYNYLNNEWIKNSLRDDGFDVSDL